MLGEVRLDHEERAEVRVYKRVEQNPVDEAEDCGIRADAEARHTTVAAANPGFWNSRRAP